MKDPEIDPPPVGESLLILNPGGVLHISSWYKGAMAYANKPVVPESVKARMRIKP